MLNKCKNEVKHCAKSQHQCHEKVLLDFTRLNDLDRRAQFS